MMLVLQIALGIVLAVIILYLLPAILAIGVFALVAVLAIGAIVLLVVSPEVQAIVGGALVIGVAVFAVHRVYFGIAQHYGPGLVEATLKVFFLTLLAMLFSFLPW